jgi:hypothetical protein
MAKTTPRGWSIEEVGQVNSLQKQIESCSREKVLIELPTCVLQVTKDLLAEANEGEPPASCLTLDSVVEDHLASEITLADVERLDRARPGLRAAFVQWLTRRRT